ncbi:MAG: GMC family oxidoreductase [Pirellulales bacterium]|nr:GMC family oxidoreductase [Pirellulales bacterium]
MTDSATADESCDICIVGTGAAGGLLAYRLAMSGKNVLSIEQGGPIEAGYFTNDMPAESLPMMGVFPEMKWPMPASEGYLYSNHQAHRLYADPATSSTSPGSQDAFVNRQIFRLNGKQNLWNAVALRMAPRDFQARDFGDSDTNWPLTYDDLKHHYGKVERLIGVCGTRESLDDVLPDGEFIPPLALRPADQLVMRSVQKIRGVSVRAIPTRKAVETRRDREHHCRACGECVFGCRYGSVYKFSSHLLPRITDKPNYRIRYHAKVARLHCGRSGGAIGGIECIDTQSGRRFQVAANTVVLACGALETPRILFNSANTDFPGGLANRSGLLGCFLQDKVRVMVAGPLLRLFGHRSVYADDCGDHLLIPRFLFDHPRFRGGFQAQVCHVLPRHPYYAEGLAPFPAACRKWLARKLFRTFVALLLMGKPDAKWANRVVRSEEKDVYGVPQVDVHYQFSDNDFRTAVSRISHIFPVGCP